MSWCQMAHSGAVGGHKSSHKTYNVFARAGSTSVWSASRRSRGPLRTASAKRCSEPFRSLLHTEVQRVFDRCIFRSRMETGKACPLEDGSQLVQLDHIEPSQPRQGRVPGVGGFPRTSSATMMRTRRLGNPSQPRQQAIGKQADPATSQE